MLSNIITILKCQNIFKSNLNLQWQLYFKQLLYYCSLQCHMVLQKSFQYADLMLKKHLLLLSVLLTVTV